MDGIDVTVACRVLNVSRSGSYEWRDRPLSAREEENVLLLKYIEQIHADSRGTYGSPRVHAELTIGLGLPVTSNASSGSCEASIQGLYRRRRHHTTVRDPAGQPGADLVNRRFTVDAPLRLWITDITEHPTEEGRIYCAAVMDTYSRPIIGWSIANHMRTELVTDALDMAILRRQPDGGKTILRSDHGSQYRAIRYTQRLADAGAAPSVGSKGDSYDNAMAEAFNSLYKAELVRNKGPWRGLDDLEIATVEYIDWCNNRRLPGELGHVPNPGLDGVTPAAGLDRGLLITGDHELIRPQPPTVPAASVEVQHPPGLRREVRVAGKQPGPVLPRFDRLPSQPPPHRRVRHRLRDTLTHRLRASSGHDHRDNATPPRPALTRQCLDLGDLHRSEPRRPAERARSASPASPCAANRPRQVRTVSTLTPAAAIAVLDHRRAASSTICARALSRYGELEFR